MKKLNLKAKIVFYFGLFLLVMPIFFVIMEAVGWGLIDDLGQVFSLFICFLLGGVVISGVKQFIDDEE